MLATLYPEIVAKAWEDRAFRNELLIDPKAALTNLGGEFAVLANEVAEIRVVADTAEIAHIVLPVNPVEDDEYSNTVLEHIGVTNSNSLKGCTMKDPNCATKQYTRPCSRECR